MAQKPTPKIPAGFRDEAEFLAEVRDRFQAAQSADRLNREAALDDLKFLAGDQWDSADVEARKGRPCLTVNRLPQFIAQVVGDIRINRPAIRVRPAEAADKALAETREGLIRAIERESDAQGVYATAGQAQVACGIGAFRVTLDYASGEVFDRVIGVQSIPNPLAVLWDPRAIDPTGRDAGWCFVIEEMPRKAFEKAWPDQKPGDLGDGLGEAERQGWIGEDLVRVAEYWTVQETPVTLALLGDGRVVDVEDLAEGETPVRTRETVRRSAVMYLVSGHAVLAGPYELPISRLPVLKVTGWEIHVGERRQRFGLVRFAKDPQRLMNYWRSVSAEMLALAPKAQWLLHESQEGGQAAFREAHASGDPVLTWSGQVPPQRIEPPQAPVAILQEANLASQDMKDVTGLHDASLGARSNETSGRAILARQREGDVASYIYHDNLQASIRECGRIVNELIPATYDTARTLRILGEDGQAKEQRVNDPDDPMSVDLSRGRYDIVVETGPSFSTKRVEAAESLLAFVQALPQAAAVAGDLIAKAQDWPMAEEIGERLKRGLPPQILQGEAGADQPQAQAQPPAPNPLQEQIAQLQLKNAQSNSIKLEAEAIEAQARAAVAHQRAMAAARAEG
jgi:hypothetical protein